MGPPIVWAPASHAAFVRNGQAQHSAQTLHCEPHMVHHAANATNARAASSDVQQSTCEPLQLHHRSRNPSIASAIQSHQKATWRTASLQARSWSPTPRRAPAAYWSTRLQPAAFECDLSHLAAGIASTASCTAGPGAGHANPRTVAFCGELTQHSCSGCNTGLDKKVEPASHSPPK